MRNIEGGPIQELDPVGVAEEAQAETQEKIAKIDRLMAEINATGEKIGKGAAKLLEGLLKKSKRDVAIALISLSSACGVQQNMETTTPEAMVTMEDNMRTHAVDPAVESDLTDPERRALADAEEPVGAEALLKPDEREALIAAGFDQFVR